MSTEVDLEFQTSLGSGMQFNVLCSMSAEIPALEMKT